MILTNKLILTSAFLGSKVVEGRPRSLLRYNNDPGIIHPIWFRAFEQAASDLKVVFDRETVVLPPSFKATKYVEVLRTFNKTHKERFEAIPEGEPIIFDVRLDETRLAPETYAKLLSIVGEHYGVSQWGSKFGYGRFQVDLIKRARLDVKLDFELDL